MTFMTWLRRQHKRDDPIGDLARDLRDDGRARDMSTASGFHQHLLKNRACAEAMRAFNDALAEYDRKLYALPFPWRPRGLRTPPQGKA